MAEQLRWEVTVKDERTLTTPIPLDEVKTEELGDFLKYAAQEGYRLKTAALVTKELGNQYDPFRETVGLKLTVVK